MRKRKRDIIIELTALLDVIMILIFMVMNEKSKLTNEAQAKYEAAQQENIEQSEEIDDLAAQLAEALAKLDEGNLDELLERLQCAESQLEGYQAMDEVVTVVNISLENKYNTRYLTYGSSVGSSITKTARKDNDDEFNQAVNGLRVFIADCTNQLSGDSSDSPTIYVIFSYNPDTIYQSDYAHWGTVKAAALAMAEVKKFPPAKAQPPNPIRQKIPRLWK